jgi:hypothetical protein
VRSGRRTLQLLVPWSTDLLRHQRALRP